MSLFKKLIPGGKSEEKRKEKLVKELHKQSGFSVAFMQEIKEKTRAIRMLKLENDEWSDDEEPEVAKKIEPAPGKKLEAIAKLMRSRKATDKVRFKLAPYSSFTGLLESLETMNNIMTPASRFVRGALPVLWRVRWSKYLWYFEWK